MRVRPWHMLILIILLTTVAGWIDLPGDTLDVAGIKKNVRVHEGLDLQGGVQVLLEARPPVGKTVTKDVLNGTRDAIERRVNGLGVSEPVIRTRGNNQIMVELPGVNDIPDCVEDNNPSDCRPEDLQLDTNGDGIPDAKLEDANGNGTLDCLEDDDSSDCELPGLGAERAVRVLQRTALLEIIDTQGQFLPEGTLVNTTLGPATDATAATTPVATPAAEGSPVASPEASPVATPVASPAASGPVYTTIISGDDLEDAFVSYNEVGQPVVAFRLKGSAATKFYDFTSQNIGRPMSIVIDKRVISSPVIRAAISNEGIIEGVPANEVQDLVVQLKAGALAVPLAVVQSRTVGPTLGQDSIDRGSVHEPVLPTPRHPVGAGLARLHHAYLCAVQADPGHPYACRHCRIHPVHWHGGRCERAHLCAHERGAPHWTHALQRHRGRIRPCLALDSRLQYLLDDHGRHSLLVRAVHRRQYHHRVRADALRRGGRQHVQRDHGDENLPAAADWHRRGEPSLVVRGGR